MTNKLVPYIPDPWRLAFVSIMLLWLGSALFGAWLLFGSNWIMVTGALMLALVFMNPLVNWLAYVCGAELVTPEEKQKRAGAVQWSQWGVFLVGAFAWAVSYAVIQLLRHPPGSVGDLFEILVSSVIGGLPVSGFMMLSRRWSSEDESASAVVQPTSGTVFMRTLGFGITLGFGAWVVFSVFGFTTGTETNLLVLASHVGLALAGGAACGAWLWAMYVFYDWTPGARREGND
jgi:hypothetical protein